MDKFLHKRRKISENVRSSTDAMPGIVEYGKAVCDICYNDFNTSNIVMCFHSCTIKTCNDCVVKQLKIEKTRYIHNVVNKEIYSIYYTCSMCQQKSYYSKNQLRLLDSSAKFTDWIQSRPNILINLLEKFINPTIPEIRLPEPTPSDDEDFEQYDLYISTAFYSPSPSLLPFPYRLLTPPSITAPTVVPAQSVPQSLMDRFNGSGSPTPDETDYIIAAPE